MGPDDPGLGGSSPAHTTTVGMSGSRDDLPMRPTRRTTVLGLVLLAASPLAYADSVKLTGTEIADLIRERTVIGTWFGTPYRQFFYADGATIYAAKDQRSTRGKWRINAARDEYQSWWESSEWEAYGVIRRDSGLFWTGRGIEPQPFEIVDGRQLVWPDD